MMTLAPVRRVMRPLVRLAGLAGRSVPAGKTGLLLAVVLLLAGTTPSPAQTSDEDAALRARLALLATDIRQVMVPMRDGVRLSTDIYLPKSRAKGEKFPVIFWRTPYNYNPLKGTRLKFALDAVAHGYAFVIQNERGKFYSEGTWEILGRPRTDGYDALTWIAKQPWSNGHVGTIGCSSSAEWQLALAAMNHPAHKAMVPMSAGAGIGRVGPYWEQGNWYRGGVFQMLFAPWLYQNQNTLRPMFPADLKREDRARLATWFDLAPRMPKVDWKQAIRHLPLQDIIRNVNGPVGTYEEFITRTPADPAWFKGGLYHDNEDWGVPALWFNAWYDVSMGPNVALFNHIRAHASDEEARRHQYMIIAPVLHCAFFRTKNPQVTGSRNMGDARFDYEGLIWDWFDYWLKGERNGLLKRLPHVRYYAMGENRWKTAEIWPPKGAKEVVWYLDGDGPANSLFGHGRLSRQVPGKPVPDRFTYDPTNPVPSLGGGVCCTGGAQAGGAEDQRPVESRQDVLVYTSPPFDEPVEVTGPITVTLYVSSDAPDTDFTAKIVDVEPDGTAWNLDETIMRARYREGYDRQVFMKPGEIYEITMTPMVTSNVFLPGHRLRIEISSSNFPRFARNLNTGGRNYDEAKPRIAHNVVWRGGPHASHVRLTVVPRTKD